MFLLHDNLIFLNELDILVAEHISWARPEPHSNHEFETWSHVDLAFLFAKANIILVRRLKLLIHLFICCDESSLKHLIISNSFNLSDADM